MSKCFAAEQISPIRTHLKPNHPLTGSFSPGKKITIKVSLMVRYEYTREWRQAHRRLDFSRSTFREYLQLYARWSLPEFRLMEEAVFEHFDELKRKGLYSVLIRLRKEKDST